MKRRVRDAGVAGSNPATPTNRSCHSFFRLFLIAGGSRVNRRFLIRNEHKPAFSRRDLRPSLAFRPPLREEGAGNAGCTLHPRSRVQIALGNTHTSIQVQPKHSGIPCAMALRLMPRSPRRRIRLVTVVGGSRLIKLGRVDAASAQLGTSNGCQDHTVLPYASASFVLRC